ncbi:MAG: M28 family peptidase [Blastocatellia bacterium]
MRMVIPWTLRVFAWQGAWLGMLEAAGATVLLLAVLWGMGRLWGRLYRRIAAVRIHLERGHGLWAVLLARLFDQTPPRAPVELVAYTLEEPPFFRGELMGSAVHARALRERGARVRAMISLEMIGCFSDTPASQEFPNPALRLLYPSVGNFIAVAGDFRQIGLVREMKGAMRRAGAIPVYSINAPGWLPGIDFSDHLNYWNAGYPAVMVTDTSFYRNKNYHTPQDTADKLDYNRMAGVVQAVFAAVQAFAPVD